MSLETCAECSTPYAVGLSVCPNCRSAERAEGVSAAPPPIVSASCSNTACAAVGVLRRVVLPRPVPGVVELPTLLCAGCGWVLPLAWPGLVESDGDAVSPKITRHGGTSHGDGPEAGPAPEAAGRVELIGEPGPELVALPDGIREADGTGEPMHAVDGDEVTGDGSGRALPPADETDGAGAVQLEEGGEESSHGNSSSTSTGKQSATSAKSKQPPRKRTGRASRSTPAPTESSSPDSPDTGGPATEPPTDAAEA